MDVLRRRVLLIANPASRRGARLQDAALSAFRRAGVVCDLRVTERAGHAAELAAQQGAGYDAVFTLGGDGTAMEVIGALAGTDTPVGVLCGGTGNLIASAMGVPRRIGRAIPLLLSGRPTRLDLGRMDSGRRFAFAAGVGIDARMIEETPAALKRRFGVLAYVLSAGRAVLRRDDFTVRATVDGETIERRASAVMVANFGAVRAELLTLGPGIRHDDGRLDLCVFSPRSALDAVRVLWRLLRKDFRSDPCMVYRAGVRFRIETDPPHRVEADGELLQTTPFEVVVEPLAALVLVP